MIHNMEIEKEAHFERTEDGAVMLNKAGKRIFIEELEKKLYQKKQVDGQSRTYDAMIRSEIQKLLRAIRTGEKYKPYKYTWKSGSTEKEKMVTQSEM